MHLSVTSCIFRVTPVLQSLHWLPVRVRIQQQQQQQHNTNNKIHNMIQCNHRHWTTKTSVNFFIRTGIERSSLFCNYTNSLITHPRSQTLGGRPFSHVGPSAWNDLPYSLCHSQSQTSFRLVYFRKVSNLLNPFLGGMFSYLCTL